LIEEEKFSEAEEEIKQLQLLFHGDTPELVRAKALITMLEPEATE